MNFTNDENDIRLSVKKCVRLQHAGYRVFMNIFCVLAGAAILGINIAFYIKSTLDFNIYYSDTSFFLLMTVGLLVMLLPVCDAFSNSLKVKQRVDAIINSGGVNLNCGCRFFNNRVEFISGCEHIIYGFSEIEKICECFDGLYFMMYSGELRYIPSRFFDRDFAYMVTERLSVIFFDRYNRREYMNVPEAAVPAQEFEHPLVEQDTPVFELNYIMERDWFKKNIRYSKIKLFEALKIIAMLILGVVIAYWILVRNMNTVLNWGILILDVIYIAICVTLHFSESELECDKYYGHYLIRFFDEHMSVVAKKSVKKISYADVYSVEQEKNCIKLKTHDTGFCSQIIMPMYAVEDTDGLANFLMQKCCNNQL